MQLIACAAILLAGAISAHILAYSRPEAGLPVFASYFGGTEVDDCDDIAVDAGGYVYLACHATSNNFPGAPRLTAPKSGDMDAFGVKLDSRTGQVIYATRFGGSEWDAAIRVVVDGNGRAVIAGFTKSHDFPTTPDAFQRHFAGGDSDGFVVLLDPNGKIAYSTLVGGSGTDQCDGLARDEAGNIYVGGTTWSTDFPGTIAGPQSRNAGKGDGFVARFRPGPNGRVQTTYLGGSNNEKVTGIVLDRSGNLFVAGFTESTDFPAKAALQSRVKGKLAAFLTKIRLEDWQLRFSTLLTGSGEDAAWGVAVDDAGNPHIAGATTSADFPTTAGAAQRRYGGHRDAFVASVDANGKRLLYSTYFGGSGDDSAGYDGGSLKVDRHGNAWLAGMTTSNDLPLKGALQSRFGGGDGDGFVVGLDPTGSKLLYATYFGGEGRDLLEGLALAPGQRIVWASGLTASRNLRTTGRLQPAYGGGLFDAMLVALPLP